MVQQADVCIICALEEEANAVEQVVCEQCKVAFTTSVTSDGRFVYRSTTITNNRQEPLTLVLLCQTRPGPVSTALDVGTLLRVFQPCFVGMSGICAGDKRHLSLGDLAVAERAYHFEEGKVTRDESGMVIHRPEGITYGPAERILQYVRTFGAWKTPVAELKKHLFGTDEVPRCIPILMASGMAVRSDDPFELLHRQHRKTWALDMEAASFYLALRAFPDVNGLVVKGVCDYADLSKDDYFHDFAARASAIYLLSFIREYVATNALLRRLITPRPIQYYSLFISYASQDEAIAKRLHTDLCKKDVPCWFAPHDLQPGNYFRERIDQAIHIQDKLLLMLSEHSVKSEWVRYEVELAYSRENRERREILFPIRLDNAIFDCIASWAVSLQATRHIGDFTGWQNNAKYQEAFTTLLRHLKVINPPV